MASCGTDRRISGAAPSWYPTGTDENDTMPAAPATILAVRSVAIHPLAQFDCIVDLPCLARFEKCKEPPAPGFPFVGSAQRQRQVQLMFG